MTQSKKQLDELFGSVASDTPTLERDELRALLDRRSSGNLGMGPMQPFTIKEDRRRGFIYKGIFIMTLIAIAITALLLSQEPSSTIATSKETIANSKVNNNSNSNSLTEEKSSQTFLSKEDKKLQTALPVPEIQPVKPIELDDVVLRKLGIIKKENWDIECYQKLGNQRVVFEMVFKSGIFGVNAGIRTKSHCVLGDNTPSFIPVYITNRSGCKVSASGPSASQIMMIEQFTDQEIDRLHEIDSFGMSAEGNVPNLSSSDMALIQKMKKFMDNTIEVGTPPEGIAPNVSDLLPILVRKNSFTKGKENNDGLIFWYAPIPEVKNIIHANAAVITHNKESIINRVTLFPNPANAKTQIRYILSEKCSINILLFEISGKKINEISKEVSLEAGEHNTDIATSSLASGIYLILIQTDRGEQSIQRLVITK